MSFRTVFLLTFCVVMLFAPALRAQTAGVEQAAPDGAKPEAYRSTMFYRDELGRVETVIEAKKNNEPLPVEGGADRGPDAPEPQQRYVYTFPQFFLKSIMYRHAEDWVIWVNNKKITSEQPRVIPHLTVNGVTRNHVDFTYDFTTDSNIEIHSASADPRIEAQGQQVQFIIEPNQTFSLYGWRIFEGPVQPVKRVIDPQAKKPKNAADAIEGLLNEVDAAVEESKSKVESGDAEPPTEKGSETKGFQGLFNRYNNLGEGL